MRTLTVRKGSGTNYTTGWHTLLISNAKYGDYNGSKFLDVWFDTYPENFTMRVYEKIGKDGEECAKDKSSDLLMLVLQMVLTALMGM